MYLNFIFFFFLLFSAYLISKIFYIQNFEGTSISLETIKNIEVESTRGNIYSSNGDLIASTVSKFEIRWDSQVPSDKIFESNKVELAHKLSELLADSTDYYIDIMNNARKNKDFDLADNIRKKLIEMGVEIKDQSNETVWKKV